MLKPVCFLLTVLSCSYLQAQYKPETVNKKAVELYTKAMERVDEGNLVNATALLQQAIEKDKNYVDAYLVLAAINGKLKNHKTSITNYEQAFAMDTNYTRDYLMAYSIQLAGTGEFQKALDAINKLLTVKPPRNPTSLENAQRRKKSYEFAIDYAKNNPEPGYVFAPVNVGNSVNSSASEYFPSVTIDGKEMVFTRRVNGVNEDFYISRWNGTAWETAKPIEGPINTDMGEAAQNISSDGQWLVFTAENRPDGFGNYDLYISYHNADNSWSEAVNLGRNVNSDQWDAQPCLSPDKNELYFSSKRRGGLGGKDIYVCYRQGNGWTAPQNLGPTINTPGDDECPFIHADNQTLYFVSNGWPGYGGNDLFMATRPPGGKWDHVKNLGYPINTINDEGTLFIAADGKTAYYASDRGDSRGGHDIYTFELRKDLRPARALWVKGTVTDSKTKKGLESVIELTDLATGTVFNRAQTDAAGNYLITLPVGHDYAFNIARKGYLFYSGNYNLSSLNPDSLYRKDISLQPIEANATSVLNNVFFDVNRSELKKESQVELDRLAQLLNENPGVKIEISGHTDNVGKPADNLALSNARAKAVITYLVSKGVNTQRLVARGYGETKPVGDNRLEEGRAMNRRTEMKILAQ